MKRKKNTSQPTPTAIIPTPAPTIDNFVNREIQGYTSFAFNKNMLVVAVGLIMATAFQKTVTAVSDFLIMPIVNYFIGKTGDDWRKWVIHPVSEMNIEIGRLMGSILDFVILTLVLYFIYDLILKRICPDLTLNQPNVLAPSQPVTTTVTPTKPEVIQITKDNKGNWKIVS